MGYSMCQRKSDFKIKKENKEAAVKALKAMKHEYAWVDSNWNRHDTIQALIKEWGWSLKMEITKTIEDGDEITRTGDVIGISFNSEKLGDENSLFDALAPYVEVGSYIEMVGEGGEKWRWTFDGSTHYGTTKLCCKQVFAKDQWDE